MTTSSATRERFWSLLVFVPMILYCLYGAVTGELYLPSRHSEEMFWLPPLNAWILTVGLTAMLLGVLTRYQAFPSIPVKRRTTLEFALLVSGIVLMYASFLVRPDCSSTMKHRNPHAIDDVSTKAAPSSSHGCSEAH
jgi:hypothetical protein